MTRKLVCKSLAAAAILAALPLGRAWGEDPQAPVPVQAVLQRVAQEDGSTGNFLFVDETHEAPPQGEYWIGIALGELPLLVKKQLKLEGGLVVEDVLPDSPAAKAEFKQHDLLLKAGDKALSEPADILKAVDEAKETELSIVAVRDGERLTLKVTPVKRPQADVLLSRPVEGETLSELRRTSIKKIEEALQELKGKSDHQALELFFARPAAVVATRTVEVELPEDMTINVAKQGAGPAKVHVKRGDKEWNVTADKTAELPEDVRRHVELLLGKVMHPILSTRTRALVVGDPKVRYSARVGVSGTPAVAPPTYSPPQPAGSSGAPPAVSARLHAYRVKEQDGVEEKLSLILKKLDTLESNSLDQLQEEVKRLRKELDELRK